MLRADTVAYHNRHRCCQAQSAGTADDQNGNAARQGVAYCLSHQKPYHNGDNGDGDNCRNKNAGHFVCDFGNGCFGCSSIADHANDLGEGGIFADARCFTPEKA